MSDRQYVHGTGKNLVILLLDGQEAVVSDSIFRIVTSELPESDITISVFTASDWDSEFSPWQYTMADGRHFTGCGKATLDKLVSIIDDTYKHVFIAGYSLAGLFSLWALHETDIFDGCACCSGSLWFGGWDEYSETHSLKKPGIVYLSLGGKEDKVKDQTIATISEKTRSEDRRNSKDPMVKKHTLVMNPGGHFASPDKRLAQGIIWLMNQETALPTV